MPLRRPLVPMLVPPLAPPLARPSRVLLLLSLIRLHLSSAVGYHQGNPPTSLEIWSCEKIDKEYPPRTGCRGRPVSPTFRVSATSSTVASANYILSLVRLLLICLGSRLVRLQSPLPMPPFLRPLVLHLLLGLLLFRRLGDAIQRSAKEIH